MANDDTVNKFNYNTGFNFMVDDDMLGFPKEKDMMTNACADSSTVSSGGVGGKFNENVSIAGSHFSEDELFVPNDDLAELEWLSNFVEESYSTDDLHLFTTSTAIAEKNSPSDSSSAQYSPLIFPTDVMVPAKARSKRSRAVPCRWSTRLLHLSQPSRRGREPSGKKCLHCASEKTPQWRAGPMGPKTLCNACGVRFKSGRLVPEYRPASSPTFLSSKHSNSHRKVLELRREKQLQQQQLVDKLSDGCDDLLIRHRNSIDGSYTHGT